jgi:hypothetical protein
MNNSQGSFLAGKKGWVLLGLLLAGLTFCGATSPLLHMIDRLVLFIVSNRAIPLWLFRTVTLVRNLAFFWPLALLIAYFWRGWGKTNFGLWPSGKSSQEANKRECAACHTIGRVGNTYGTGHRVMFLCNECVYHRAQDLKLGGLGMSLGLSAFISLIAAAGGPELGRVQTPGVPIVVEYPLLSDPSTWIIVRFVALLFAVFGFVVFLRTPSDQELAKAGRDITGKL